VRGHEIEHPQDLGAVADHVAVAGLPPAQEAVPVHDECRAVGDVPVLVEHAVGPDRRAVHVAQEREGDAGRARERVVAEGTVAADGEHGGAALPDLARDLAQVAQLGASDGAKVVAVEDQHDVGPPAEVGERDGAAARRGEREVGGGLAEPERRHGGQCTPNRARRLALHDERADARQQQDDQEHDGADHVRVTMKYPHAVRGSKTYAVLRAVRAGKHRLAGPEKFFRGCGVGDGPAMVAESATSEEDAMDGWWNDIERDVRAVLERHGSMTPAEMARLLRLSEGAVSSVLSMLAQEGKLRIARVELPPRDDGRQLSL
jgi:hypothetical protein